MNKTLDKDTVNLKQSKNIESKFKKQNENEIINKFETIS